MFFYDINDIIFWGAILVSVIRMKEVVRKILSLAYHLPSWVHSS